MNIYFWDKQNLLFKNVNKKPIYIIGSLFIMMMFLIISSFIPKKLDVIHSLSKEEKILIIQETDSFNQNKLIQEIKELNISFPHIVLAQSMLETDFYKSPVWLNNKNLFGMRESKLRPSTNKGTELNHAVYNTWKESLYDYGMWQCKFVSSKIKTDEQYYMFLIQAEYAEDQTYINKLKKLVDKYNLKQYFNSK